VRLYDAGRALAFQLTQRGAGTGAANCLRKELHYRWQFRGLRASLDVELQPPSAVGSIEIVNAGSLFVTIQGQALDGGATWQILVPRAALRTEAEAMAGKALNRQRTFGMGSSLGSDGRKWKALRVGHPTTPHFFCPGLTHCEAWRMRNLYSSVCISLV